MKELFGAPPTGRPAITVYADYMKREIGDDDDFMTAPKQAPTRPKAKSGGSSKEVTDENSDDDFMPAPRRAPVKPKAKRGGSSKAVVNENSDDDFM